MSDDFPASVTPTIPHSREAEEAAVGSVLINPETFHEIRLVLSRGETEFYIHRHRYIWAALERLIRSASPIDLLTVSEELDRAGQLSEIGGPAYLTALVNQVPSSLNAAAYAGIVHAHFIRRELLNTANAIATHAYDEALPLDEVASRSSASLNQAISLTTGSRMVSIAEALRITDALIDQRRQSETLPGIPTGLIDLDRKLGGGAQRGDLIEVANRPGGGKSSLLIQIAQQSETNHVALFSLEMSIEQVMLRMISQRTGIDYQALRSGRIPDDKWSEYYAAYEELNALNLHIDDTPRISPVYLWSKCELMAGRGELDLVLVDYLSLMKSGLKFSKTSEEVDYLARELKAIARTFDIPVWVAHQMNRNIEHRDRNAKPALSDLNEGGEKDADVVIFIHNKLDDRDEIESSSLVIAKHRNGPTGEVPIVFRKQYTKFFNAARI